MAENLLPAPFPKGISRSTWILLGVFAAVLFCHLDRASLWYADEYRGAERAREFLVTGNLWTVQENFQPSFRKPPLHYWLTAATLRLFGEGKFAMRFWTCVFAVGTLVLSAMYVRLLAPDLPLAPPLTVVAVALYGPFLEYVQIGLLDAGLMFWILSVLVCAELAQGDDRWWLAAGLCAGLGSLYKVPLPFGVWIFWLVIRARDAASRRAMRRSRWLWCGLAIATVLTAAWPAVQIAQHGGDWWSVYVRAEAGSLLLRQNRKGTFGLATYPAWLLLKWWLFAVMSLAGVGWALWKGRSPAEGGRAAKLYETAAIAAAYLVIVSSLQAKSHRYELPVIPLLAAAGVVFFLQWPMSPRWRAACIAAGVLPLAIGFWPHYFKKDRVDFTSHIHTAQRFGASTAPAQFLFTIDGIEDPSFLLFFGKLRQPVYEMPEALAVLIDGSWHGLISSCDWPALQRDAPTARKISDDGRVVEFVRD